MAHTAITDNRTRLLNHLITEHGPALERFLARKLHSPQDAAEIAQETFLRLYRLDHLDKIDDTRAFLFRVASNMAIDQLRRKVLRDKYRSYEENEMGEQHSASPEQIVEAEEQLRVIYQAVESLPLKCKQAFLLHRLSGLSYSEIADEMAVSVSSVEKYILQALKHCRKKMAARASN
jgi:RNA polymerase sigma-70 factor (ECF subfamily)